MKLLFLFLLGLCFYCCNVDNVPIVKKTKLEMFIDSFEVANPNYQNNNTTQKRGDSLLKLSFIEGLNSSGLIDKYPVKFYEIVTGKNSKPYAHFLNYGTVDNAPNFDFDLVVPITDSIAETLKKDSIYFVENSKSFVPLEDKNLNIRLTFAATPLYSIRNSILREVQLGVNFAEGKIVPGSK